AGGLLLECPTESFVQTTDHSWKNSQARPRRLRPQAPNLRQYSRCPRDPLEVRASNHLMVAQDEGSVRCSPPPRFRPPYPRFFRRIRRYKVCAAATLETEDGREQAIDRPHRGGTHQVDGGAAPAAGRGRAAH